MKNVKFVLLVAVILLLGGRGLSAETIAIYGHISLAQPGVTVLRAGETTAEPAIVNLPLLAGDAVLTTADGRCEIQSDNGTIVRLDHDSELLVESVLAQSLTSNWKVTTLKLVRGGLYVINNTYEREMAQVQTDNAAIKLDRDCRALVGLQAGGVTAVRMLNGRAALLYGKPPHGLSQERIKGGQALTVGADDRLQLDVKEYGDFLLWNEGIDRHFNELHEGISRLPKPLQRYSPALVYWAEKWSSVYGEWVWDDIYGYMWKPYTESFTWHRPFFNASRVTIHGTLFLVPQEPWGWAPAYLGTWHWMGRHGWVWIPGDFGRSEPWYMSAEYGHMGFYTMWDWFMWVRRPLYTGWFNEIWPYERWSRNIQPLGVNPPPEIARVMKAIANLPAERRRTELEGVVSRADGLRRELPLPRREPPLTTRPPRAQAMQLLGPRDWNPDAAWAGRAGMEVHYRPETNEFVCPRLKIESNRITPGERARMWEMGGRGVVPGGYGHVPGPATDAGVVNPNATSSQAVVGHDGGGSAAHVDHKDGGRH